jgi:hypothetical protein
MTGKDVAKIGVSPVAKNCAKNGLLIIFFNSLTVSIILNAAKITLYAIIMHILMTTVCAKIYLSFAINYLKITKLICIIYIMSESKDNDDYVIAEPENAPESATVSAPVDELDINAPDDALNYTLNASSAILNETDTSKSNEMMMNLIKQIRSMDSNEQQKMLSNLQKLRKSAQPEAKTETVGTSRDELLKKLHEKRASFQLKRKPKAVLQNKLKNETPPANPSANSPANLPDNPLANQELPPDIAKLFDDLRKSNIADVFDQSLGGALSTVASQIDPMLASAYAKEKEAANNTTNECATVESLYDDPADCASASASDGAAVSASDGAAVSASDGASDSATVE